MTKKRKSTYKRKPKKTGPKGPMKMKGETLQKLEFAFSIDATVREACFYADISESTYYQYVKDDPKLLEKFNRLRENPVLTARMELVKGLIGNPELSLKYLERKKSDEFHTRKAVEHSGEMAIKELKEKRDSAFEKLKKLKLLKK